MSNLNTTKCKGWTNPSTLFYGPKITSLSSYYSPSGQTSLVTINGENFYTYSIIKFATFQPTVYFVSSNALQFYVPSSLGPGTYPIQVINDTILSNIVNYNLDNSSGYWLLETSKAGNPITNTNNGGGLNVKGNIQISGDIIFPDGTTQTSGNQRIIGEIKMFGGLNSPPANYLFCDGSFLLSTDANYSALFNVIQYTYGQNGLQFALPDLRQKFPIGSKNSSNMNVNYIDANGTTNSIVTGGNQTMLSNQLGQHSHNFTSTTTVTGNPVGTSINNNTNYHNSNIATLASNGVTAAATVNIGINTTSIGVTTNGAVGNNNYSNSQEDLLPPFSVVQYIICYK